MSSDTLLLEARNIARRRHDGHGWLLADVSLQVHAAGRLAVTGASGSGKTLLLRALAMLDPLDGGQVRFKGKLVHGDGVPDFRRQAIYLHQRAVLPEERVEAALQRPLKLCAHRWRPFDRDRIAEWLGQLGRDESFLAKRVGDLSGGEIQIAALLRAIQLDPAVLLLDEPAAALDRQTTTTVEQLLGDWIAESPDGRAMVWVTHDARQAHRVADRMLCMEEGTLNEMES